jgi:hypothetical protein
VHPGLPRGAEDPELDELLPPGRVVAGDRVRGKVAEDDQGVVHHTTGPVGGAEHGAMASRPGDPTLLGELPEGEVHGRAGDLESGGEVEGGGESLAAWEDSFGDPPLEGACGAQAWGAVQE